MRSQVLIITLCCYSSELFDALGESQRSHPSRDSNSHYSNIKNITEVANSSLKVSRAQPTWNTTRMINSTDAQTTTKLNYNTKWNTAERLNFTGSQTSSIAGLSIDTNNNSERDAIDNQNTTTLMGTFNMGTIENMSTKDTWISTEDMNLTEAESAIDDQNNIDAMYYDDNTTEMMNYSTTPDLLTRVIVLTVHCLRYAVNEPIEHDYMLTTQALYECLSVAYFYLKEGTFSKFVDRDNNPFDDLFKPIRVKTFSHHDYIEYPENYCLLEYGSFLRMPSISPCVQNFNGDLVISGRQVCKSSANTHAINASCSQSSVTKIAYFKAAWLLAKLNYGLIVLAKLSVLLPSVRTQYMRQRIGNSHSVCLFIVITVLWTTWRLQENLTLGHQMASLCSLHLCGH